MKGPIIFCLGLLMALSSCLDCNDVGFIYTITLEGEGLQEFYTVRSLTGDTLNRRTQIHSDTAVAVTVPASLEDEIENLEQFVFHLFARDTVFEKYDLVYRKAECNLEQISGPSTITY